LLKSNENNNEITKENYLNIDSPNKNNIFLKESNGFNKVFQRGNSVSKVQNSREIKILKKNIKIITNNNN